MSKAQDAMAGLRSKLHDPANSLVRSSKSLREDLIRSLKVGG